MPKNLPVELVQEVFSHFDPQDALDREALNRCMQASKELRSLAAQPILHHLIICDSIDRHAAKENLLSISYQQELFRILSDSRTHDHAIKKLEIRLRPKERDPTLEPSPCFVGLLSLIAESGHVEELMLACLSERQRSNFRELSNEAQAALLAIRSRPALRALTLARIKSVPNFFVRGDPRGDTLECLGLRNAQVVVEGAHWPNAQLLSLQRPYTDFLRSRFLTMPPRDVACFPSLSTLVLYDTNHDLSWSEGLYFIVDYSRIRNVKFMLTCPNGRPDLRSFRFLRKLPNLETIHLTCSLVDDPWAMLWKPFPILPDGLLELGLYDPYFDDPKDTGRCGQPTLQHLIIDIIYGYSAAGGRTPQAIITEDFEWKGFLDAVVDKQTTPSLESAKVRLCVSPEGEVEEHSLIPPNCNEELRKYAESTLIPCVKTKAGRPDLALEISLRASLAPIIYHHLDI